MNLKGQSEHTGKAYRKLLDATGPYQATIDKLKKDKPIDYQKQISNIRNKIERSCEN